MIFAKNPQVSIKLKNLILKLFWIMDWGINIRLIKKNKSLMKIYLGFLLKKTKIEYNRKKNIIRYPKTPNV